ncbi:MAG: hypothetical protein JO112_15650 [Planctomycetes bacterium]|nr:hypothetical protein [Planctomycetota bacterium]
MAKKRTAVSKPPARKKTARKPRATAAAAAPVGVLVVNMIPQTLSSETNQDSEPMLAVHPNQTDHLVGTAFTPDPMGSGLAPYFQSTDGGATWILNAVVPGGNMTGDITVAFSGTGDKLFAGILRRDSPQPPITRMAIVRTNDFTSTAAMDVLEDRLRPDQPFAQATTVANGAAAGKERLYVGNNDFAASPQTATLDVALDAGSAGPVVQQVRLEHRAAATAGQDGPQIRPSIHSDGTVYAAFYGWRSQSGDWDANTLEVTADVVVVRDDHWGDSANPFEDLIDPGDNLAGLRVVRNVTFAFNQFGKTVNGQQRLGGTLSIAVDPRPDHSGTVYLAWGSDEAETAFTIHVRRSTDRGLTWSATDLLTLPRATNAALAINSDGVVALLYQQLSGTGLHQRWATHLRRTSNGQTWSDLVLADTPANMPAKTFDPYLGDYDYLTAVGKTF